MNYEETKELEQNVKMRKKADELYNLFMKNIKLTPDMYKGEGLFLLDYDGHNYTSVVLKNDTFYLQLDFLHENYNLAITPSDIFNYIKEDYKGVGHLEAIVKYGARQI